MYNYLTLTEKAVNAMSNVASAGSIVTGVYAVIQLWSYMRKSKEHDEQCNRLKSELQKHKTEMENIRTNQKRNERAHECLKSKGKKQ